MSDIDPSSPTPTPASAPPPTTAPVPHPSGIPAEERQWAMIAHLSALLGGVVSGGWGHSLACFVGPLIVWLIKKDTMPFVDDQGKEALNFNITIAIVFVLLALFSVMTLGIGLILALPAYFVIAILWLVFTIVAAIKSHEGVAYRYPFALRLIK